MLTAYKPALEELWFREALLADAETMAYNAAWGGTIPFPRERWTAWYGAWVEAPASQRYYRYLYAPERRAFIGEIAYHYDAQEAMYLCDVIVLAKYRGQGFGGARLRLLCDAARENGLPALYDDIAANNPSWKLFLKNGFSIARRTDDVVLVRKEL